MLSSARWITPLRICLVSVGLGAVLAACEEPVELGIELPKSRLVIESNFLPDEPVELRLSATRPVGGQAGAVTDAQVTLFEGRELAERLTSVPTDDHNGTSASDHFRTVDFVPRAGRQYTVHVTAPGFDPVTAVSSIPRPVDISKIGLRQTEWLREGVQDVFLYELEIDYNDPPRTTDYYDLHIRQEAIPFRVDEKGDTIRLDPIQKSVRATLNVRADQAGSARVLLRDRPDDGPLRVALRSTFNNGRELPGRLVAELRTVSEEYYFYRLSTATRLPFSPAPGLSEPVIVYHNVDSGLGIFAGYNFVQRDLPLDH